MSSEKDTKLINLVSKTLAALEDFKGDSDGAGQFAKELVTEVRASSPTEDDFKDQLMGIVANVKNLNGHIKGTVTPLQLATMDINAILSEKQKKEQEKFSRKRARQQINENNLSLLCEKCSRTRKDRINLNQIGLDSEENGTQFDYHFDALCSCSHSSTDDGLESEEEEEDSSGEADRRAEKRVKE
ncbi:hypothetical protein AGDE_11739 [Angomonas deanei]|nr:hypothetical protein AGDE_11739 [Angomonas deanei]|eukprot:EPY25468.1 hypothetical protein AGDE_11739 [Angomonas deanei]